MGSFFAGSHPSNTTSKILSEALKIPSKNWPLHLPLAAAALLSSSLLFLANYLCITPLLLNLSLSFHVGPLAAPGTPEHSAVLAWIKKDIKDLAILESVYVLLSFFISASILIATISASAVTYFGRQVTAAELLSMIQKSWKAPLATQLLVAVLNLCVVFLLVILVTLFVFMSDGSVIAFAAGATLALLSLYMYVNLSLVWVMSVVISVVEEGCYGVGALARAIELVRGRQRQGAVIAGLFIATAAAKYAAYTYSTTYIPQITAAPLFNALLMVNASVLLNMLGLAACTVFYYECRRSHGEDEAPFKGAIVGTEEMP